MTSRLQNAPTTDDVGRLPAPQETAPISEARFDRLAASWRRTGLWLTMWDRRGELAAADRAAPFWPILLKSNGDFIHHLARLATGVLLRASDDAEAGPVDRTILGPWSPDLGLVAVPIRSRTRTLGVVLAAAVFSKRLGEGFDRLCSNAGVDRAAMEAQARKTPTIRRPALPALIEPLSQAVDQARLLDEADHAMGDLARNLDSTYEELNLVYRVGARLGLPQDRMRMLEHVGRELVHVSRVCAVGFVLPDYAAPNAPRAVAGAPTIDSEQDRVIQVGRVAPTAHDLEQLAASIEGEFAVDADCLLLNNASRRRSLNWTAPWLEHVVATPLVAGDRRLGLMLAMNCDDGGDFTSVDVQLFRAIADRITTFIENQRLYDDLTDLLMGLLHALVNSIDAKDPYTCGHSERVAFISRTLARKAGLTPAQCQRVYLTGLLHDVGKLGIPDAILTKPGKLTREEFTELKRHPEIGVRILSRIRQIQDLMPGVLYHHERMDGRGYPRGLAGRDIPLLGRIICLADCFDAMTTSRTYRAALPLPLAISEIRRCSGTQFDVHLAEQFLQLDLGAVFEQAHALPGGDPMLDDIREFGVAAGGWPRPIEDRDWESVAVNRI